jgi:hypothetical protein
MKYLRSTEVPASSALALESLAAPASSGTAARDASKSQEHVQVLTKIKRTAAFRATPTSGKKTIKLLISCFSDFPALEKEERIGQQQASGRLATNLVHEAFTERAVIDGLVVSTAARKFRRCFPRVITAFVIHTACTACCHYWSSRRGSFSLNDSFCN